MFIGEGDNILALLIILVIIAIVIVTLFDLIVSYELLQYKFKKMRLGLNLGKILSRNQLKAVLQLLLNEDIRYGVEERRLNIFSYKWQFMPFYLFRQAIAHVLKNKELKEMLKSIFDEEAYEIAYYCENNNFIEIYEFNLIRWCNEYNIDKKEYLIKVIFHEYRHKYQYNLNMILNEEESEKDAEDFAESFFIKNKLKIENILSERY